MNGRVAVVAVNSVVKGVAAVGLGVISVMIRVGAGAGGTVLIDLAVAVIVDAIVADFRGIGMNGRVVVVAINTVDKGVAAIGFGIIAVAVRVGAGIIRAALVYLAVAVIVDPVADLSGAGTNGSVVVVAVNAVKHRVTAAARFIIITVTIRVPTVINRTILVLVHLSVAIIIDAVAADLRGVGINRGVVVVAVNAVQHGVAEAARFDIITVTVRIGAGRTALVHISVTVIVDVVVTGFGRTGINVRAGVVAVNRRIATAFGIITVVVRVGTIGTILVDPPVAVVVDAVVTDFGRTGANGRVIVVAVDRRTAAAFGIKTVTVRVGAVIIHTTLVDLPVAVVVDGVVTDFGRTGANGRVVVVAIDRRTATALGVKTVTVRVGAGMGRAPLVHLPVAVVVDAVTTDFGRAGMKGRVRVITIAIVGYISLRPGRCVN
jgi:hypothetical protein